MIGNFQISENSELSGYSLIYITQANKIQVLLFSEKELFIFFLKSWPLSVRLEFSGGGGGQG